MSSKQAVQLTLARKASPFPYGLLAVAEAIKDDPSQKPLILGLSEDSSAPAVQLNLSEDKPALSEIKDAMNELLATFGPPTPATQPWLDLAVTDLMSTRHPILDAAFAKLDDHLAFRTYLSGEHKGPSLVDYAVWGFLKASPIFGRNLKSGKLPYTYLARWFLYLSSFPATTRSVTLIHTAAAVEAKGKKDQGSFEVGLEGAIKGQVVTRFPPEPSGYLHIGHAKAALLNQYFARHYEGRLIIRFDDTNPSKEKAEFEESIIEDLRLIGVHGDQVTHTSDYFDKLYEDAITLIRQGLAYVDDTDQATMRTQRMDGIASARRDRSIEENERLFTQEMAKGTEEGIRSCLRAKMSVDDPNKALRDPVIFRVNLTPHHRTGTTWKVYPTYDFACPLVDAHEGVTHALRTNEYRDRNPQYKWFLKHCKVRTVHIWDFSRINFVYTLLSKRKLTWFVEKGLGGGWDDPRFPTVRGIRRRGMSIEALNQYILMQGASQNSLHLEWDKLWALNKRILDPVAPRHVAITEEGQVPLRLTSGAGLEELGSIGSGGLVREMAKHKKNPEVGMKRTHFSPRVFLDQADAQISQEGEEVTLMDWGNVIIQKILRDVEGKVTGLEGQLHLEGDFKKTKRKLTWLSSEEEAGISATLLDYDYLISKKKLEEDDQVEDHVTAVSEFRTPVVVDANVQDYPVGQVVQLERRGYYIVDKSPKKDGSGSLELILIPDGKASGIASKADAMDDIYGEVQIPDAKESSEMYTSESFY
ncbi:tRNA synthetases class I, catalytic domain-containing protein [Piptocephalis cylindrospora]|uniref:Probable glutamate--tRNA ligase, cytoplasmic n=1 Tax=Piptocephalis cylindrospora TaxID=1907219 RepID=A0A4V1IXM2_9FUNG|nr:tRNA synthetases class I, catalytic domain-containing protein [Piptocephalis cylindrospora]|eukprot:RKP11549.1 tRNA synthetases class I, catalytic domain-containing protein [Piptocephalis cylindrospora]